MATTRTLPAMLVSNSLSPWARGPTVLTWAPGLSQLKLAELLAHVPDDLVRVNYDTGNSASLGFEGARTGVAGWLAEPGPM